MVRDIQRPSIAISLPIAPSNTLSTHPVWLQAQQLGARNFQQLDVLQAAAAAAGLVAGASACMALPVMQLAERGQAERATSSSRQRRREHGGRVAWLAHLGGCLAALLHGRAVQVPLNM